VDPKKVMLALRWLIDEMERRYRIFARVGVRNIVGFNVRPKKPSAAGADRGDDDETSTEGSAPSTTKDELQIPDKMPYVVVIIDELADLMKTAPADVKSAIPRIHQIPPARTSSQESSKGIFQAGFHFRLLPRSIVA